MGTFFTILGSQALQGKSCWSQKYRGDFSLWGLDFIFKVHVKIMQIKCCACLRAQKTECWSSSRDIFPGSFEQSCQITTTEVRAALLNSLPWELPSYQLKCDFWYHYASTPLRKLNKELFAGYSNLKEPDSGQPPNRAVVRPRAAAADPSSPQRCSPEHCPPLIPALLPKALPPPPQRCSQSPVSSCVLPCPLQCETLSRTTAPPPAHPSSNSICCDTQLESGSFN